MKINIKDYSISSDMPKGVWFLAKCIDNRTVIVQRLYWKLLGYDDVVVYLHHGHLTYDTYETFRRDYTIIKEVEEITVE